MRLQEIPALAGLKVRTNQGHPICSPDFAFVITYAIPSKCPVYVELPVKLKWTIRLKFPYIFIWFLEFLFQKVLKHCKWQQLWLITRVSSLFHWLISSTMRNFFFFFLKFLFQNVFKHCKWDQLWLKTRLRSMFFHALVDLVYNAKKKLFLMSKRPWWKAWLRRTFRPLLWINPRIRQCQCPSHSSLATTFFVTLLVAAILSFNDNCTPAELPRPACRQNIFSTFVNPITVKNYLIAGFFDNEGPEECSSWQVNNSILGANGPHLKQYVAPYHVHAVMYQWQPKSRFPLEFCAHCLKWHNNIPLDPLYFAKW